MVDCRFYPQLLRLLCFLSLSSLALFLSLSSRPLMPSLPLARSFLFLPLFFAQGFTNTFLLSLTPCLVFSLFLFFWLPLPLPITSAGEKSVLQQSSPAAADCLYMATSYSVRQVGGGGMQLISFPRSLSWLILSHLFIVCMCAREGGMHACVCVPEAIMIHQTRTHSQGITIFHYLNASKLRETYFRDSVLQVCAISYYFLLD